MSAVADGVGRAVCALTGAWRGEAAEPPTHSIADGTALRCGRVGSRHFRESPSGLSFFVPATLLSPRCSAVPREPMCTACVVPVKECLEWHSECRTRRIPIRKVEKPIDFWLRTEGVAGSVTPTIEKYGT